MSDPYKPHAYEDGSALNQAVAAITRQVFNEGYVFISQAFEREVPVILSPKLPYTLIARCPDGTELAAGTVKDVADAKFYRSDGGDLSANEFAFAAATAAGYTMCLAQFEKYMKTKYGAGWTG